MNYMKLVPICALAIAVNGANAQGSSTPPAKPKTMMEMHHGMGSGWKELDAFHTVLAATWHPIAGESDFKPLREQAPKLVEAAKIWKESKAPAGCNSKEIGDAVATILAKSQIVADLVDKKATDAIVKAEMKSLHDQFESAEGGCKAK